MSRGGYKCAMKDCSNISGRVSGLSFFRFPMDPERSKLWLKNCGRVIKTTTEKLHKNYRVCGNHFESSMFLNNLRNRLQPHAFPVPLNEHLPYNFLLISDNQISLSHDKDVHSVDRLTEIISKEKQKDQQVQTEIDRVDQQTQTDAKSLSDSPRKERVLKNKIRLLERELKNIVQQLEQDKRQRYVNELPVEKNCNIIDHDYAMRIISSPKETFTKEIFKLNMFQS